MPLAQPHISPPAFAPSRTDFVVDYLHDYALRIQFSGMLKSVLRPSFCAVVLIAFCVLSKGQDATSDPLLHQSTGAEDATGQEHVVGAAVGTRVAEGEYRVLTESGIGPTDPAVYGFSETWTMWRLPDGTFEVKGTRSYRSPSYESHSNDFIVHLSSGLNVLGVKEFRKLAWRSDSGPLSCDFLPRKITCTSNAKDPAQNVTLDLSMENTFGFLWPISAFSLSGITRLASRDPKRTTPVELVRVEEDSKADPIRAMILSGHLTYLGSQELTLAGREWRADKFELELPVHAPFLVWVSPDGLLLAFAPETKNKTLSSDGMVLVKFKQLADF